MAKGYPGKSEKDPWFVAVLLPVGLALAVPAFAETADDEFLSVLPLPDAIEAIERIPGAVNARFQDCEAVWPDGYRAWRAESVAAIGHSERGDIYGWLRTKGAFEKRACDCGAKVAPWDPVDAIYEGLKSRHGTVMLKHTAIYENQARIYRAAVERMCGGDF